MPASDDHEDLDYAVREASTAMAATMASVARSPVRREVPRHAPHRLRHDGDGDHLQAVEPSGVRDAHRLHAVGEGHQRDGRRSVKPSHAHAAEQARAHDAERDAHLAAGRAGQELAQRDEIGVVRLIDPAPPDDVLLAEIPEMRDRPAERREAEPRRGAKDLDETGASREHHAARHRAIVLLIGPKIR